MQRVKTTMKLNFPEKSFYLLLFLTFVSLCGSQASEVVFERKVVKHCNAALAGLTVTLTRSKASEILNGDIGLEPLTINGEKINISVARKGGLNTFAGLERLKLMRVLESSPLVSFTPGDSTGKLYEEVNVDGKLRKIIKGVYSLDFFDSGSAILKLSEMASAGAREYNREVKEDQAIQWQVHYLFPSSVESHRDIYDIIESVLSDDMAVIEQRENHWEITAEIFINEQKVKVELILNTWGKVTSLRPVLDPSAEESTYEGIPENMRGLDGLQLIMLSTSALFNDRALDSSDETVVKTRAGYLEQCKAMIPEVLGNESYLRNLDSRLRKIWLKFFDEWKLLEKKYSGNQLLKERIKLIDYQLRKTARSRVQITIRTRDLVNGFRIDPSDMSNQR